jgi:hypothetical protein
MEGVGTRFMGFRVIRVCFDEVYSRRFRGRGIDENCVKNLVGKIERKSDGLQDLGLYVRIILKMSLER